MNALSEYLTVLALALLLTGPALVGLRHERRIDRQMKAAQAAQAARPAPSASRTQKSSSRSTVPSTATWYADGRRSKKLVSS
ncbi:hypothetical protein ABT330_18580 [Streptomyces sp. NPDC000658]|uniref:hypothetical protein n=1 Tax=Streptomyces sp. NPDC000658 TaxID=3154266 RepID=UPI00332B954C